MGDAPASSGAATDAMPVPDAENRCFTIAGLASPQLLPRLIGLFAQQNLLPRQLHMDRGSDMMALHIVQDALDEQRAGIILEKMLVLPEVSSASLASGRSTLAIPGPEPEHGGG